MAEYSDEFDRLRKNRVAVSYHKYGPAQKNFGEGRVDALATAQLCLDAFRRDHNTEHLVDGDTKDGMFAIARFEACLQEAERPYYASRSERYGWEDLG